jgi:ABC-type polysaccharide/polyol phosphate export permease
VLDGEIPNALPTLYFGLFASAVFLVGFVLFNRTKKQFADLI